MNLNNRLKELKEEIEAIKTVQHNAGMSGIAKEINKELKDRATPAEVKFKEIAKLKNLNLKFQYRINIYSKNGRIRKFYFADFCDTRHRLIFEIDGEYHNTVEQAKKDKQRTRALIKAGYKVFRITNTEVLAGKSTNFLYHAYKSVGITI